MEKQTKEQKKMDKIREEICSLNIHRYTQLEFMFEVDKIFKERKT